MNRKVRGVAAMKKYLVSRTPCPVGWCGSTFITKPGFLQHMRKFHEFTSEELEWPRRFLKETPLSTPDAIETLGQESIE